MTTTGTSATIRDIDRYRRTVAEIILPDARNLNQELVRAGMA
jgi:micrococcal nuclease